MAHLENIKSIALRDAIINLQVDEDHMYYGFFAMYFNYVEDNTLQATAGVTLKNKQFYFYYNSDLIETTVKKNGPAFLKFLIIHECQHILLHHIQRSTDKNHNIANIAQDMIINENIKTNIKLSFKDFYYLKTDYDNLKWKYSEFKGLEIFEDVYEVLVSNQEKNNDDSNNNGDSQGDGDSQGNGDSQGDGDSQGEGKPKNPQLVDCHDMLNKDLEEMTDSERALTEKIIGDIHENLKARGMAPGEGLENSFNFKKKKTVVNVFKRVFGNGVVKTPTYKKLSRRHAFMKGSKKENRDVNLILDVSGSLYNELDQYLPTLVGNWNCYVVQVDTSIQFSGFVNSIKDWKNVKKMGGGGTILQPALNHLIKKKRHTIPTMFLSDFYCETLDLSKFKGAITFVKSKGSIEPQFINANSKVKVITSQLDVSGVQQ